MDCPRWINWSTGCCRLSKRESCILLRAHCFIYKIALSTITPKLTVYLYTSSLFLTLWLENPAARFPLYRLPTSWTSFPQYPCTELYTFLLSFPLFSHFLHDSYYLHIKVIFLGIKWSFITPELSRIYLFYPEYFLFTICIHNKSHPFKF